MKVHFFKVCVVMLVSLTFFGARAQNTEYKFGKVQKSDVELITHPLDTSASAVILADIGRTEFRYSSNQGFTYELKRLIRIKVLTKDGLSYGDFSIPFYHNQTDHENVSLVKGITYNMEGNKVTKTKLERSSIFTEETSNNWMSKKISMPNVQVGSVIEITYSLSSPFLWNLNTWYFQSEIPTVYNEYNLSIPEYFDYQFLHSGYVQLTKSENSRISSQITIQSKNRGSSGRLVTKTSYDTESITYYIDKYLWVSKDVPAYKPEAYIASKADYISKIEFELRGTKFPNQPYEAKMGNWTTLNKHFLDHEDFGTTLSQTGFMNAELAEIAKLESKNDQIVATVRTINQNVAWDEKNRIYSESTRKSWMEHNGSSADINLMLVAALRELGFQADPVLISTRQNGVVNEAFAMSKQFNYVIAAVEAPEGLLLLDATEKYFPIGVLPERCLNGQGWRVSESKPGWLPLKPSEKSQYRFQGIYEIEQSGIVTANVQTSQSGYSGFRAHRKFRMDGEEDYLKDIVDDRTEWVINEHSFDAGKTPSDPFKCAFELELSEPFIVGAEKIYVESTQNEVIDENPFKIEKRDYPVDFTRPIHNTYLFKYKIPKGYEVEELPKSIAFALPNHAGKFTFNTSSMNGEIQVLVDFRIEKTIFIPSEYSILKQFYSEVLKKCNEQIVLAKISNE